MYKLIFAVIMIALSAGAFAAGSKKMITDSVSVVKALDKAEVYIMPQPREVVMEKGWSDISKAKGITLFAREIKNADMVKEFSASLKERCGVDVPVAEKAENGFYIRLYIVDDNSSDKCPGIDYASLKAKGTEAYAVSAGPDGIVAAANDETGLLYAMETIVQMFAYKQKISSMYILDYPALKYRGMMYDISRGQMPKPETMKKLVRLFARGKSNMMEVYLEDMLKFKKYPDIAPADAYKSEDILLSSTMLPNGA